MSTGGLLTIRKANELLGYILLGYCKNQPAHPQSVPGGVLDRKEKKRIPEIFKDRDGYHTFDNKALDSWADVLDHLIRFEKEQIAPCLHFQEYKSSTIYADIFEEYNRVLDSFKYHLLDFFYAIGLKTTGSTFLQSFCYSDFIETMKIDTSVHSWTVMGKTSIDSWMQWAIDVRARCIENKSEPLAARSIWVLERELSECLAYRDICFIKLSYPSFSAECGIDELDDSSNYTAEDYWQILNKAIQKWDRVSADKLPDLAGISSRKKLLYSICTNINPKLHFETSNNESDTFFFSDRAAMNLVLNSLSLTAYSEKNAEKPISTPIRRIGFNGFDNLIIEDTGHSLFLAPPPQFQNKLKYEHAEDIWDGISEEETLNILSATREELYSIKERIAQLFVERKQGFYYNSKIAGVFHANPFYRTPVEEKPCLYYRLYQTDYYTHRVIESLIMEKLDKQVRFELAAQKLPFNLPAAARSSLGINLLIEMRKEDGTAWLMLTRRSSNASYGDDNKIYLSVTETVAWDTVINSQNPIEHTIQLGIIQELGIKPSLYDKSCIHLLGSFFECNYFQDNIFALLRIKESDKLNETEFAKAIEKAQDGYLEIGSSFWISTKEIIRFMNDHKKEFRDQAHFCLEWYIDECMK